MTSVLMRALPPRSPSPYISLSMVDMRAPELMGTPLAVASSAPNLSAMPCFALHGHISQVMLSRELQVQHHKTHLRTLYPRIVSTRGHFFFTSHAESPMCAWDTRCAALLSPCRYCPCILLRLSRHHLSASLRPSEWPDELLQLRVQEHEQAALRAGRDENFATSLRRRPV